MTTTPSQNENKYYIVEVIETENIQRKADDVSVNKEIVSKLKGINKRKFITGIIAKINEGNFKKNDFDSLSIKENASIKKNQDEE